MKYTYVLVNFFTIVVPFLFSFHPKLRFYEKWRAFFPAVLVTGLFFIAWDVYFTHLKVWGFNPNYILGIKLAGLPLEEILFFLCIPYSCVFTYHCLTKLLALKISKSIENLVTFLLILLGLVGIVRYFNNWYTATTSLVMLVLVTVARFVLKVDWLGKFFVVYAILLIPFCIVNGILTGSGLEAPVVWYNENEIIGWRILTIPFEDVFYGLNLILLNLLIYQQILRSSNTRLA